MKKKKKKKKINYIYIYSIKIYLNNLKFIYTFINNKLLKYI